MTTFEQPQREGGDAAEVAWDIEPLVDGEGEAGVERLLDLATARARSFAERHEGRVAGFREKPRSEQWINGGFFVFERPALAYMSETSVLEREPLEALAGEHQLQAYRHEGFWRCMDTYKDAVTLNDLWRSGAPWATSSG